MELLPEEEKKAIIKRANKIKKIFKNPITNIFLFETLGSLILSYGICVSQYVHPISRKEPNHFWTFLISCFNFLAISIAGLFTGGHINPTATIGLYVAGVVEKRKVPVYLVCQLIGAFLGTTIYFAFFGQNTEIYNKSPEIKEIILDSIGQIVGTSIFVFGVLHLVITDYMKGQPFRYFFISLMLLVARTYSFRKGCLNPAVAIAFQTFSAGSHGDIYLLVAVIGLIIGQVIGAVGGGFFYVKVYEPLLRQVQKNN